MSIDPAATVALVPLSDVVERDGRFEALTPEPWLALPPHRALRPGRFVEIVYRLGLWDEPVRPVFRFVGPTGVLSEHIGAGSIAGAAHWIGRVPAGTRQVQVSPTCRPGPFDFRIESITARRLPRLLWRGLRQAPRQTRSAILTRVIGWRPEAEVNFRWAIAFSPLKTYAAWSRLRARAPDLATLERPRFAWDGGPSFDIILAGQNGLARTLASLSAQLYPNRRVRFARTSAADGTRLVELDDLAPSGERARFVFALQAGQALRPEALAVVAEQIVRYPDVSVFYADEEIVAADRPARPLLKPGWSPTLFAARPYLGRAVFLRENLWQTFDRAEKVGFVADATLPVARLAELDAAQVRAVPRIVMTTAVMPSHAVRPGRFVPREGVRATIIIPTRDRADLLARCLASLRHPAATTAEIVVVDNGSVEAATTALFETLRADPQVRILSRPGPFNYAGLCNDAASGSTADLLVFLNNDTAVRTPDWLDRLAAHALQPDVGAVGAKLLRPDGRIQHTGVVLGLGGLAGHFGALQAADTLGWDGRHVVAHDVAAVTGACLAVERRKFAAVDGFDAAHLPVELNDIDLCLRLAARGWRTRMEPAAELLHEESASRGGATLRRLHVYAEQRDIFAARWRGALRDDPFFHPGLSLYNVDPALG